MTQFKIKMANAQLYDIRRHIFFFDSRGFNLERELNIINTERKPVEPFFFNGATIKNLVHEAINYGRTRPFDLMFVVGGICNITDKDRNTGKISFILDTPEKLSNHIINIMEDEDKRFKKELPASKLIFCRMVGANLENVLKRQAETEQLVMDEAIYQINEYIFRKNIDKELWAPDMATPVHRINGKMKSNYEHLSRDGIHLSQELKKSGAKKLLKTAYKY